MNEFPPSSDVFTDVRGILAAARCGAYTAVNSVMVAANWHFLTGSQGSKRFTK